MWTTTKMDLVWKKFRDGDGRPVYIRLDLIEAFGEDWVQAEDGRRYEGLVLVPTVMTSNE